MFHMSIVTLPFSNIHASTRVCVCFTCQLLLYRSLTSMECSSCPKPRPIMHPHPFKSPDPWGGWNKAHNKASAQRHEKRVAEYLQWLEEEESATATSAVGDSAASSATSDNTSLTVLDNISEPPTCNTGASSPLGSHEDDMEEDTSVATESWDGLNSSPLGNCRYKLFIGILNMGYLMYRRGSSANPVF